MLTFIRENFRWLLGGFVLTFFSSFGQTYFIAASVGDWQQQFGLSHGEVGRLYMLATLASAATLPFIGRVVDLTTELRVLLLVIPSLTVATLLAAFATNVVVLFVAVYLLRLFGQGMMTHTALTTTGRWFSAGRGRAVSLVVLGHQGGEVCLLYSFAILSAAYGYQAGWLTAAAMLVVIALPVALWAYRYPRVPVGAPGETTDKASRQRQWTRREVVADPLFYALLIGVLAPAFIGTTIFYHQDYLATLFNWSPDYFPRGIQLMAVTTMVCALLAGALVDRFGAWRLLPVFLLPLGFACFALAFGRDAPGLYPVMLFLGISYGFSTTLFGALWPETYGATHLGAIRSVTVSAAVFSTAAGPGITGTLIDAGFSLPVQMHYLGWYCMGAAVLMVIASRQLQRRHRRQSDSETTA